MEKSGLPLEAMMIESSYLAAENAAQERRSRSVYRFIVVSPAALLLTVGLVGHLSKPPHPSAAGDSVYDRRVLAYRNRVMSVGRLLANEGVVPAPALADEARAWVAGYDSGILQPLPPAAFEDHFRDGARGEIALAGFNLASRMASAAQGMLLKGDPSAAMDEALLAAEAIRPLGDSELIASVQGTITQHRALYVAACAWAKIPDSLRTTFRVRLRRLLIDPRRIDKMGATEMEQIRDYAARQRLADGNANVVSARLMLARRLTAAQHGVKSHNTQIESIVRTD